ncbi:MAG: glycoside hydrolase family 9 protein [Deltaproteobacteria bacterium]|nr:glycoside hydrolase family 9 protein [Deltaproteobacteria bacterium]
MTNLCASNKILPETGVFHGTGSRSTERLSAISRCDTAKKPAFCFETRFSGGILNGWVAAAVVLWSVSGSGCGNGSTQRSEEGKDITVYGDAEVNASGNTGGNTGGNAGRNISENTDGNTNSDGDGNGEQGGGQNENIESDPYAPPDEYGPPGPYAEALQKSLYFYDVNMSGIDITGGRLQWRGNSEVTDYAVPLFCNGQSPESSNCTNMSDDYIRKYIHIFDPDGIGTVNVGGGFHDCGDHVKFGLPQAYSASMLAWSVYEFPESFIKSGQAPHALDILRRFTNYFLRSTFRERDGRVIAFCHQVGVGPIDHSFWGPPELQKAEDFPRPAWFATEENPGADVTAAASAALTIASLVFRSQDPDYADRCLDTAEALYAFAAAYPGTANNGGFYASEFEWDDLAWAAIWLHIATGETSYLEDIVSADGDRYTGWLSHIMSTKADGWYNAWTHCWNTVWTGMFIKLAQVTGDEKWTKIADDNANLWSGVDGNMGVTPGGLTWLTGWGSLRYTTAAIMATLVWGRYTGKTDAYVDWAQSQFDYIAGDNPLGKSFIVGFGDEWPVHIHNRAAHGSTKDNSPDIPPTPNHVAWGALLGGPDKDDGYNDDIWNYGQTEVCIDFASSLVGALSGLYYFKAVGRDGLGQAPLQNFPPLEPEQVEYWVEGQVGEQNSLISEVHLMIHNETIHPPYLNPLLSFRYYFNVSELAAWGQGVDAFRVQATYDGRSVDNGMLNSGDGKPTIVTGPFPYDEAAGIYYFDFAFTGCKFYGSLPFEFQLVAEMASDYQSHQDSSNDYSIQGLPNGREYVVTPYVTLYSDGELIAGKEP